MNIDWKWLIIGVLFAWFGIPFVQGLIAKAKG